MNRRSNFNEVIAKEYDFVIIGGGITGAGILWEANKYNYKTLLIEKGDFASGTSSKSAKLIHGGLRYLQYAQFGLVKEAIEERNYLLRHFPYLVKPIEFIFPIYSQKWKYALGMFIYQFFNKGRYTPGYSYLSEEQVKEYIPCMASAKLKGAYSYYDAVTNDARLCNEIIMLAEEHDHLHALNYFELISSQRNNDFHFLNCYDHIEKKKVTIKTRYVINAAGPWASLVLNRLNGAYKMAITKPSKGAHIILSAKCFPIRQAILFSSNANDKRMLYAVPWENDTVLVGATDSAYMGSLDVVTIDDDDINYILKAISHFVPSLGINKSDIIGCMAGIRPLINDGKSTKDASREYQIWWDETVLSISGGKLTSFRSMAKAVWKEAWLRIEKKKRRLNNQDTIPFHYANKITVLQNYLQSKYGDQAEKIWRIGSENPFNLTYVHPSLNIIRAEVLFFIRHQQCYHIDDLLYRRFSLLYSLKQNPDYEIIIKNFIHIMQKECDWSLNETEEEFHRCLDLLKKNDSEVKLA